MYFGQAAPTGYTVEDRHLLAEAKDGNTEAFGEIYVRHAPGVFRFIYAYLGDHMDAEDLTEDVFLKAWKSLNRYHDIGLSFQAYLHRIALNTIIDHYRSKPTDHTELEESNLHDPQPGPIDHVVSQVEHNELRNHLNLLSKDHRTVLEARFISDLSPQETARLMGKSAGAVRVLQHRALNTLRKLLDGSFNGLN